MEGQGMRANHSVFFFLLPESATRQKKNPKPSDRTRKHFPARTPTKKRGVWQSGTTLLGVVRANPGKGLGGGAHISMQWAKKAERGALEGLTRLCCLCNRASIQKVFSGPLGRAAAPVGGREERERGARRGEDG